MLSVNTSSLFFSRPMPTNQPVHITWCCAARTCQIRGTMNSNGSNSFHILLCSLYYIIMLSYIVHHFPWLHLLFQTGLQDGSHIIEMFKNINYLWPLQVFSFLHRKGFPQLILSLYLLYSIPLIYTSFI